MSVFDNRGTQHCGVRLPGGIRSIVIDGPQFCSPQPRGRADRFHVPRVADECGVPIPQTCVAGGQVDYPTCYTDPAAPAQYQACVLDGFRRITIGAACEVTAVDIRTLAGVVVPNAVEVTNCARSSLPGQPV